MSLTLDIHALQTLPPSNINRDDTGAPKTALYGGVIRHRVSSQAWKKAIRDDFRHHFNAEDLGVRSKRVVDLLARHVIEIAPDFDPQRAAELAKELFTAAGIKIKDSKKASKTETQTDIEHGESEYLLFLSNRQLNEAARYIIEHPDKKPSKKEVAQLLDQYHSIDIAMFGRMLADAVDFNVDASVQVAHAIGVSETTLDFDYFTAVDDEVQRNENEVGAGMIGTVQMASSTLYRFATIDLLSLHENLAQEPKTTAHAAVSFVESFVKSLPTGKLNSFANNTLPDLVYITLRDDRAVSLVHAFEEAIPQEQQDGTRGVRKAAALELAKAARAIESTYGMPTKVSFIVALDDLGKEYEGAQAVTFPELLETLPGILTAELEEQ
ncbi:type I-E CRISPR-associated protein Cas7/Cse4/CasC [Schaalia sp. lx-100]|uniref:type I-E CRISPR-associated protein Cas7/Cse4/CasC n=1 Tax=Schaalia sp. lx-100 TaxID=2899081 RepID=UPI001E59016B|nr:type I-E CRISPR-associated protein Cas7/Cse4/CasC [Schaalia sp. lx-100]MCD4556949.1 type I-E CRISPR-associated protein Cas7/Cse4/CasC [Schaalia sp. lx-100]